MGKIIINCYQSRSENSKKEYKTGRINNNHLSSCKVIKEGEEGLSFNSLWYQFQGSQRVVI